MPGSLPAALALLLLRSLSASPGPQDAPPAGEPVRWISGRVVLPADTPAGEQPRIEALGRRFADGSRHAVALGPEGRFRVAVPERTRTLRLALRAPHLFLPGEVRLRTAALPDEVVLTPRVGGRLVVQLGRGAESGSVVLEGGLLAGEDGRYDDLEREPREEDGALVFDGLPAGPCYRLAWEERDGPGSISGLGIVAGGTQELELDRRLRPRLRARVLDAAGRPLAGAELRCAGEVVSTDERGEALARLPRRWSPSGASAGGAQAEDARTRLTTVVGDVRAPGHVSCAFALRSPRGDLDARASLVLAEAPSLTGRVVFPDGSPAGGAEVELVGSPPSSESGPWRSGMSDAAEDGAPRPLPERRRATADGAGRFTVLAPSRRPVGFVARAEGGWVVERSGVEPNGEVALALAPGASLVGRVHDAEGTPLRRGLVRGTRLAAGEPGEGLGDRVEARFEAEDGGFRIDGLLDGQWSFAADGPEHFGLSELTLRVASPGARDGAPIALGTLRALPAAGLRTRVIDDSGRPVAGAEVHAWPVNAFRLFLEVETAEAESAADGAVSFERVLPGGVQLSARAPGRTSRLVTAEVAAGETLELPPLVLRPGASLAGVALDERGEPMADALVELYHVDSIVGPVADARSKDDGSFAFPSLDLGPHELVVRDDAEEPARAVAPFAVEEPGPIELVVRPRPRDELVDVRVRLSALGRPRPRARVFLSPRDAIAAERVREALEASPGEHVVSVLPGEHDVTVLDATGIVLTRVTRRVELAPGATEQELALELPRGRVIGLVRGHPGLETEAEPAWIEPVDWREALPFGPAEISLDRFAFRGLPAGRYRVLCGSSAFNWDEPVGDLFGTVTAEVQVFDDRRSVVRLLLPPAAGAQGVVRSADGRPVPAARLWAWTEDGQPLDLYDLGCDLEGRFVSWNLPERVWLAATSGLAASRPERFELEAGRSRELELVLAPAAMLAVRLVDAGGAPTRGFLRAVGEAGLAYRTVGERRPRAWEAPDWGPIQRRRVPFYDGFFHFLGPLTPGRWELQAKALDGRSATLAVEVGAGEERALELVLR